MSMVLEVPKEIEDRVILWSERASEPPGDFMLRAIEEYLEDLEDYEDAVVISDAVAHGEEEVYTSQEVRRYLGLEG